MGSGARKQAEGRAANGLVWPWITPSARLHTNLPCPQVGASMAVPPWVTFSPTNGPLTVLPCTQGWPAYLLLGTHTPRLSPAVGPRGQMVTQHRSLLGSRGGAGSLGVLGGGQAWLAQSYVWDTVGRARGRSPWRLRRTVCRSGCGRSPGCRQEVMARSAAASGAAFHVARFAEEVVVEGVAALVRGFHRQEDTAVLGKPRRVRDEHAHAAGMEPAGRDLLGD